MVKPTKLYWKATKHALRYLRGTTKFGIWYRQIEGVEMQGFPNVDFVGSPLDMKSTSSKIFSVGLVTISWYNRK